MVKTWRNWVYIPTLECETCSLHFLTYQHNTRSCSEWPWACPLLSWMCRPSLPLTILFLPMTAVLNNKNHIGPHAFTRKTSSQTYASQGHTPEYCMALDSPVSVIVSKHWGSMHRSDSSNGDIEKCWCPRQSIKINNFKSSYIICE